MEKISEVRKYLRGGLGGTAPSNVAQQVLSQEPQQAISNVPSYQYRFTYDQTNSQALCQTKARVTKRIKYKAR